MVRNDLSGFSWNPETRRMERGNLYLDPITNTIQEVRSPMNLPTTEPYNRPVTQVEGIKQLEHQAGEPLVTFPDGTTMTRAEYYIQRGLTEDRTGVGPVPPTMTPRDLTVQDQLIALEKQAAEFPSKLTEETTKVGADGTATDPLVKRIQTLAAQVFHNEKISDPASWTKEQRTAYESGNTELFSKLRGYTPEQIKQFKEYQEAIKEYQVKYGDDAVFDIDNPWTLKETYDSLYGKGSYEARQYLHDNNLPLGKDVDVTGRTNPYFGVKQPHKINVEEGIPKQETPKFTGNPLDAHDLIKYAQEIGIPTEKIGDAVREGIAQLRSAIEYMENGKKKDGSPITYKDIDRIMEQVNARPNTIGNAMVSRYLENFKRPQSGVGGKQGGAANFGFSEAIVDAAKAIKKKISKEDFTAELQRLVPNITNDQIDKLYQKHYGDVTLTKPVDNIIKKIPGVKETISPELQSLDSMMDRWKNEPDISGNELAKVLRENLSAGGRMTALRTGNSYIDWHVENILGETRKAQVKIKEITHGIKGDVKELAGGFLENFRNKNEGTKKFVDVMAELMRVQGKNEVPNITDPIAKRFATNLQNQLAEVYRLVNQELQLQGSKLPWEINYLAHSFFGPYRVLAKDAEGNTVGVIAGRTKAEMNSAMEHVKTQLPEVEFGMPEYNRNFDNSGSELGKRYAAANEILNSLKADSPLADQFQKSLGDYLYQTQKDYMGYRKHFRERKGAFGFEGNRSWDNAKNNAYDMLEAQLAVVDHAYMWLAEQKLARDLQKVFDNPEIKMPEAKEYVNLYLDHAFGRTKDQMAFVDSGIHSISKMFGISPASSKEAMSIARNFALTHTLGMSGGFMLTQFVQVPQALGIAMSKARGEGMSGNGWLSIQVGNMDLIYGLAKDYSNMSTQGKYFFDYFKKQGTFDPHLIEHQLHRQVIPTAGMKLPAKIASSAFNGVLKAMNAEAGLVGKWTIEKPEVRTRGMFAMTMAHYYHQAGMSLKEAAVRADKDTSTIFTDYSPQERAMMFQRMGELGKFASTVSTFKINNLNQYVTFTKNKQYGTLLALVAGTALTSGLFGLPGTAEAEFIATQLKERGLVTETPREIAIRELPDAINFGPLGETPKIFGGPGVAIGRKFSQENILPDTVADAIYALASYWTRGIGNTVDYLGQPTQENKAKALRSWLPGNLKYLVDYGMLTDQKTGITKDVNTIGKEDMSGFSRDKAAWKSALVLGVPTNDEFRTRTLSNLDKISQKAWKDRQTNMIDKALAEWRDGNSEQFKKLYADAIKFAPDTAPQALITKLESQATTMRMTKKQSLDLRMAREAFNIHNINRLQRYQESQGR
jgi:NACalpha-BTF3-like transcription factor